MSFYPRPSCYLNILLAFRLSCLIVVVYIVCYLNALLYFKACLLVLRLYIFFVLSASHCFFNHCLYWESFLVIPSSSVCILFMPSPSRIRISFVRLLQYRQTYLLVVFSVLGLSYQLHHDLYWRAEVYLVVVAKAI